MDVFENLCDEAQNEHIRIVDMPAMEAKAVYVKANGKKLIALPHADTSAARTCMLAEELGHSHTGGDCVLHYDKVNDWKAEAKARRWGHDRLLSRDAILTAARNAVDEYEIAFVLNVTVEFLRDAINGLKVRGLWAIDCSMAG